MHPITRLADVLDQYLEQRHDNAIRATAHPRPTVDPVWVAVINPHLRTPAERRLAAAHLRAHLRKAA